MRIPSQSAVSKAVLLAAPLLASPALADDAAEPIPHQREWEQRSVMLLEVQPPALDASMYGIRLDIAPSLAGPFSFGLTGRAGQWGNTVGTRLRFEGPSGYEVKLNYAIGVDGRYMPFSLANGTLRPFLGLTAGFEEFVGRTGKGPSESVTTVSFVEPSLGLMWRPGAGRMGLSARVGPGFTFADSHERALELDAGLLKLRPVYPTASLNLLFVL